MTINAAPDTELNRLIKETITEYLVRPYILACDPFAVTDNLYFVGNSWVSSYLIDTGDGLVLIDTTFSEAFYQVVDNIYRLGFNPRNIKYVFLSHAHFDHFDAAASLQKMTKCKVWLGADDAYFMTQRPDLTLSPVYFRGGDLKIDAFFDYSKPMTIGSATFHFYHTPGHTPGTTTFLIGSKLNGKPVTCAMHGGLGINGLTISELRSKGLPERLQNDFYQSLLSLRNLKVDIVIPSHNTAMASDSSRSSLLVRYERAGKKKEGLVDTKLWYEYLTAQINAVEKILGK